MNLFILLSTNAFEAAIMRNGSLFAPAVVSTIMVMKYPLMGIAVGLIALTFAVQYYKGLVLESGGINYGIVFRGLIVFAILGMYIPVMDAIFSGLNEIAEVFIAQDAFGTYGKNKAMESLLSGAYKGFSIFNIADSLKSALFLISVAAREMVLYFRAILLSFLIIAGPFALVASLIPGQESNSSKWFISLIATYCWYYTIIMIDTLILGVGNAAADGSFMSKAFSSGDIIAQICLTLTYFMTPYLTGKYISGSTGGFMSKMIGGATAGFAIASGGTSKMASFITKSASDSGAKMAVNNTINNASTGSAQKNTSGLGSGYNPASYTRQKQEE